MAYAAIRASATSLTTPAGTSHTVSLPATVSSGDLLVVVFATDGNPTVGFPGGWTSLISGPDGANTSRLEIRYKTANGTEGGTTISVTTSGAEETCHRTFAFSGWDSNFPPEAATLVAGFFDNDPNPGPVTASWGALENLYLAVCSYDNGTRTITAYPTGYTGSQQNDRTSTSGGCGIGTATRELNGDTDNPVSFTMSTDDSWCATVVVIAPGDDETPPPLVTENVTASVAPAPSLTADVDVEYGQTISFRPLPTLNISVVSEAVVPNPDPPPDPDPPPIVPVVIARLGRTGRTVSATGLAGLVR